MINDILRIVGLQLGAKDIKMEDRLVEDLGAESADVANIVAAVESKYGIHLKESEIARIFTPADLLEAVQRHMPE